MTALHRPDAATAVPPASAVPDSLARETLPIVAPSGFREYDARWLYPEQLNLVGAQALGRGLGTLVRELGAAPDIVVGHDYRSYSAAVKLALVTGLIEAGLRVRDIGLALSPTAYFAQFALDCACVAMVTASHNENGWTGVKMGAERPLTFGPEEMARLKAIVGADAGISRPGGSYERVADMRERYLSDLLARPRLRRRLKVVAACGNGTAGAFAPDLLEGLGCEVVRLDCDLDHSFPRYNPNPEDLAMLHAMADAVRASGADLALGFDGDGDRCGVVDEAGGEIFSDKVGALLARDLSRDRPGVTVVVDVKSTALFATDPVLRSRGVVADYWKTGHSHIKRRVSALGALAGFEKSGHFFFGPPIGRGYDDGLLTAVAILEMLDRNPGRSLSDLYRELPRTFGSPTMSPGCADAVKYDVVSRVTARIEALRDGGGAIAGEAIRDVVTVNGVRVTMADGTWGLVRASSNKPELVVVVESPVSEERLRATFAALDGLLRENPEVGAYNQAL